MRCHVCRFPFEVEEIPVPWEARFPSCTVRVWAHPHCARAVKAQNKKPGWGGPKDTAGSLK